MRSNRITTLTVLALTWGSSALPVAAADTATEWVGTAGSTTTAANGDVYGNWTSGANWTNGIGVNASLNVLIGPVAANGGRVIMNSNADGFGANELWVGGRNPALLPKIHSLTISGGILQHTDGTASGINKYSRLGDGGTALEQGVINQTGGTLYMNQGELRIGANIEVGGNGLYDISGGTFSTAGGLYAGGNVILGSRMNQNPTAFSKGELRISGNATVDLGLPVTAPQALGFGKGDGSYSSSILSVIGSQATINIHSIQMVNAAPSFNSGLIKFSFDQTGVSTIHVAKGANLAQGFLDVNYTGTPLANGSFFDLMVGDQIVSNSSFTLDTSDTTDWQLSVLGTGVLDDATSDTLRLTYVGVVPEPASMTIALVGLGCLFVIRATRRWRTDA